MDSSSDERSGDPANKRVSRRRFLAASTAMAGWAASSLARPDSLTDVPARVAGTPPGSHSDRSPFVHLDRIPGGGPGQKVDPAWAFNSKTPFDTLKGTITPTDLHYERSHSGVPSLDPSRHRLLVHGMVHKPFVLTLDDLLRMPSLSRVHFIECTGNGWENWKQASPNLTVQLTHGLISTSEWTGVPLRYLIDRVGKDRRAIWMLAEGGDAAGVDRSIPLTDEILDHAFVAYAQNGEPLRPAHGYPIRLIVPGFEGNLHIKWLRRLKFGDRPWMTRWETDRYTQLLADGEARQFQLRMDVNSVITSPSGMMKIAPGYQRISGLAWSGHGRISHVEVSTDGGRAWRKADITGPVHSRAQTRFEIDWSWDGAPTKIVSRSIDERGNVQPDRKTLIARTGTNALFHYNAQQTWDIDAKGDVRNALA